MRNPGYPGAVLSKKQKIILLVALGIVNFVYFISSAYITCSNDGSHFALVSALSEKGTVGIRDYIDYTQMYDFAYKDGGYYSDRTPGTAFLGVPFYLFGKLVEKTGLGTLLSGRENINEVFIIFLPNIAGTISVLLVFRICMFLKGDFVSSLVSSLIFAFCTLAWFESTHLFSHVVSMAVVLAAVYLVITMGHFDSSCTGRIVGIASLVALASVIEIQNILLVGVLCLYILLSGKVAVRELCSRRLLVPLLLAGLVFLAIYSSLLVYNYIAFNELTVKSNKYHALFTYERTFRTAMAGNILLGSDRLLANVATPEVIFDWSRGIKNDTPGLFIVSPILFMSLVGYYFLIKFHKSEAFLFVLIIVAEVAVAALHTGDVHTRYATTILPFLFLPVVYLVRKSRGQIVNGAANPLKRFSLFLLLLVFSLLSMARVYYVMNTYWGRELSSPFMFVAEIPSYVFFYAVVLIAWFALRFVLGRGRRAARIE